MKLYRYISLQAFCELIYNSELTFKRPKCWPDQYEGHYFKLLESESGKKWIEGLIEKRISSAEHREETKGDNRAAYGKYLLQTLSDYLTKQFGKGFSVTNLKQMRQFYLTYGNDQIGQKVSDQSANLPSVSTGRKFFLSWSHYLKLMRISNVDERHFYEIEAAKNDWSLSQLQRQFGSALYERLALSTNKEKVYRLALEGQSVESPKDAIKDPYVLEFLGLKELPEYSESKLESRIIDNLQRFLLELGTGFAFVGRQVRFTFDEEHFLVD